MNEMIVRSGNSNAIRSVSDYVQQLERRRQEYETSVVRCGLVGRSGAGKSSLINAIAGSKVAPVGSTETTDQAKDYVHHGLAFVDIPGCGTAKWPRAEYVEKANLASLDAILLITSDRFYEDDAYLYHQVTEVLRRPCFVVRNKFDLAVADELHDNALTEDQTREKVTRDIAANLHAASPDRIYLTSARHPQRYDLPELIADVVGCLQGIKRDRFIADAAAYNKEFLTAKRGVAEKVVGTYAGLSAANALNPIPGLDVSVDLALLHRMSHEIAHIYGTTMEQSEFSFRTLGRGDPRTEALKHRVIRMAAEYLAKEAIVRMLKGLGKRAFVRYLGKWAPFVGQLVSGVLGYRLTFGYGERVLEDNAALAEDILQLAVT